MDRCTLVRYAKEGFQNHKQSHLQSSGKPIDGCHAFLGEDYKELLSYQEDYHMQHPDLANRTNEPLHVIQVPSDTRVWVMNKKLPETNEAIYIDHEQQAIFIPEEPLQPFKQVAGDPFPLPLSFYVEVPVSFAMKQYQRLQDIYEWLKTEQYMGQDASINTRMADYCQCIIDCSNISSLTK